MNPEILIAAGLGFVLLMGIASVFLLSVLRRQERFTARVLLIQGLTPTTKKAPGSAEVRQAAVRVMATVGQAILRSGVVPAQTLSELENTLAAAGLRGSQGLGVFIGAKIVGVFGLPVLTWVLVNDLPVSPMLARMALIGAAVLGLLAPDRVIADARKRYVRCLERAMPDVLDMMVICTQAGLGLGPAIVRVAAELRHSYPEAAAELETTATEMQLLSDSRVAIIQLGTRTGLESLKRLSATLLQSLQYGTPLSDALRVLSAELRQQMLNRFEARVARLPVMMTLPTIIFILPCVFLVAGGPAIIQLMRAFSH